MRICNGCVVTAKAVTDNGTSEEVVYTVIILGDLSGDGILKINDAAQIVKALNENQISDIQRMAADMSQDGAFKIDDAARLLKKIDNWDGYTSKL